MIKRRFVYEVSGFFPYMDNGRLLSGGFGFSVFLDRDIARKAFETELPEDCNLNDIGRQILVDCMRFSSYELDESFIREPYHFLKNDDGKLTSLLHWVGVPGDACDLGIDHEEIEDLKINDYKGWVEYHPHNVDTLSQASFLLSLFIYWANTMNMVLDDERITEE